MIHVLVVQLIFWISRWKENKVIKKNFKKLFVLGNRFRGDDAICLLVVDQLKPKLKEMFHIREHSGEMSSLISEWEEDAEIFILDAVKTSQGESGELLVFDLNETEVPADWSQNSTHGFGLAQAIELAISFGSFPAKATFIGINGSHWGIGENHQFNLDNISQDVFELLSNL